MLETDEASVNRWVAGLRKSMKKQGMSDGQMNQWLPRKRKVRHNAYDLVVSKLMSNTTGPKEEGQKGERSRWVGNPGLARLRLLSIGFNPCFRRDQARP
ncbi:MAG: hypothetical protein ABSC19_18090 [Syntrophorhabdales bacterium]|jgi:hypothetical protein